MECSARDKIERKSELRTYSTSASLMISLRNERVIIVRIREEALHPRLSFLFHCFAHVVI